MDSHTQRQEGMRAKWSELLVRESQQTVVLEGEPQQDSAVRWIEETDWGIRADQNC